MSQMPTRVRVPRSGVAVRPVLDAIQFGAREIVNMQVILADVDAQRVFRPEMLLRVEIGIQRVVAGGRVIETPHRADRRTPPVK